MKKSLLTFLVFILLLSLIGSPVSAQSLEAKLIASDGWAGDMFASSVSVDGNIIVVGVPGDDDDGADSGSAYVFIPGKNGWSEGTRLIASDSSAGDMFGWSVSVEGDTIVIGAPCDDDNGYNSGSAYVFVRDKKGWSEEAKLTAGDGSAFDRFGDFVAIDRNTIVIGAIGDDDNGTYSGSAYVFVRDKKGWSEEAKLIPSDSAAFKYFGESVAIDRDTIVVGAIGDDDNGTYSGSAYVFVRDKKVWSEEAKLIASDGSASEYFGESVSVDRDTIVVGAHGDHDNGTYSGSAYVFVRDKEVWSEEAKLLPGEGAVGDRFGQSVSVEGQIIIVGALGDDDNGYNAGLAYVFVRGKSGWGEVSKLMPDDSEAWDHFGEPVAVDGHTIVVGATGDDDNGTDSGSAYVFNYTGNK